MSTTSTTHFDRQYQRHLKHLKLKGLQPKTIEAYSRAIRRIGKHFDQRIDSLTEPQLADYFTELMASHSWSAVKLDLYGLKFYYEHVLREPWVAPWSSNRPYSSRFSPCTRTTIEYSELQQFLMQNPDAGELVPGSGGVRKVRWARPGIGKRGGLRII